MQKRIVYELKFYCKIVVSLHFESAEGSENLNNEVVRFYR